MSRARGEGGLRRRVGRLGVFASWRRKAYVAFVSLFQTGCVEHHREWSSGIVVQKGVSSIIQKYRSGTLIIYTIA